MEGRTLTQVLNVLVTKQSEGTTLRLAASAHTGTIRLEDDDAIGSSSRDECGTV